MSNAYMFRLLPIVCRYYTGEEYWRHLAYITVDIADILIHQCKQRDDTAFPILPIIVIGKNANVKCVGIMRPTAVQCRRPTPVVVNEKSQLFESKRDLNVFANTAI